MDMRVSFKGSSMPEALSKNAIGTSINALLFLLSEEFPHSSSGEIILLVKTEAYNTATFCMHQMPFSKAL